MLLSIGFSAFLYQISSAELQRNARRPLTQAGAYFFDQDALRLQREQYLAEGQTHLLQNLFFLNLATLLIGGGVSYALARWTLHPVEEAMEMQGRFTADASHELRTPLTAMQTEIEVALRDKTLTKAEAVGMLESNLEEIAKLRALSDGLLKLTRLDQQIPKVELDLAEATADAVERLAKTADQKHVELRTKLTSAQAKGDASSLTELAAILIDNAIKYSPATSKVLITTKQQGKQAILSVQDWGPGIKASDQPHIFERFYRADTSRSKERIDGYGLGLSIAHQIAKLHHGTLTVQSSPGKGATLTLKLPSS